MSETIETTVTSPCRWATKEDWIAKRGLTAQLYEKQTLPKVMHLMETQYGFKATNKMYKTHIKQWDLKKKNQQHEIRAQRCRQMVVDYTKILQLVLMSPETKLECSTAVPTLLTTPGLLRISERIFNTIRDYYRGSFESGMWVSDQEGLKCRIVKAGPGGAIEDPSKYLNALQHHCTRACILFDGGSSDKAGKALIAATAGVKKIIHAEHPLTLSLLFGLVLEVRGNNRHEVALAILRQFSAFAEILLGDQHPLRQVCGWLASVDTTCFDEVVVRCLRKASEHLENNLGPVHQCTLYSHLRYAEEVYRHENTDQGERLQRNLLDKCERVLGVDDIRTMEARVSLASFYIEQKNYSEVGKMGQDTMAYSHQARSRFNQYSLLTLGLYIQAIAQYELHEAELAEAKLAEANLREANVLRQLLWGEHDGRAKYWLLVLKEWLSGQGQLSHAS